MDNNEEIIRKCDLVMALSFYALAFFVPISIALVEIFAMLALIMFFVKRGILFARKLKTEKAASLMSNLGLFFRSFKPVPSALSWPIGIFILINFISVIFSQHHVLSLRGFFFKLLQGTYIYFTFLESITTKRQMRNFLAILLISAAIISLDGIVQCIRGTDFIYQQALMSGRATASFRHTNDFGAYLLIIIPLVLSFLLFWFPLGNFFSKKKLEISSSSSEWSRRIFKPFVFILSGLSIFCLGFTYSRGAWIGFLLSLIFWGINEKRLMLILLILCFAFWVVFFPMMEATRRVSFVTDDLPEANQSITSQPDKNSYTIWAYFDKKIAKLKKFNGMGRSIFWQDAIQIFKCNPFLGSGLNTYSKVASRNHANRGGYPHNCYLQMAAETGLAGVLAFLWILFAFFRTTLKTTRIVSQSSIWRAVLMGLLVGLTGFLIHSFFDTNLYSVQLANFFWLILGVTMGVQRILAQESA